MSADEEHIGPFASHDDMCSAVGTGHPYNARTLHNLHWYDGPIYSVVVVQGDTRPRLDVMVDHNHHGESATRVFEEVRHQLVFDRMETLEATLREGCPTPESYRLAEYIVRYRTRSTRIDHPRPSHEMWTSRLTMQEVPVVELPDPAEPQGLHVPGLDAIQELHDDRDGR